MTTSILLSNEFSDEKSGGTEFSNTLNQTLKFDGGKWKVALGEFAYQPNSWDNLHNVVIELKMRGIILKIRIFIALVGCHTMSYRALIYMKN